MSTPLEHWKRLITQKHLVNRPSGTFQWTNDMDKRLREHIEAGMTYTRITILMGLPPDAASVRSRELGIGKRTLKAVPRVFTQTELDMLNGPLSAATVAKRLGLSTKRVHFLRETGLWPSGKKSGEQKVKPSTGTASATK
ncbi:MAG: hypothetical protein ACRCTP_08910 [Aeromonas popoffii]|jgi:hypothetical protein|uniref:hypothetical protein n=1 Tax=Aeromonas popoffii TaxID=70856 RepID=UPI003F3CF2BB